MEFFYTKFFIGLGGEFQRSFVYLSHFPVRGTHCVSELALCQQSMLRCHEFGSGVGFCSNHSEFEFFVVF